MIGNLLLSKINFIFVLILSLVLYLHNKNKNRKETFQQDTIYKHRTKKLSNSVLSQYGKILPKKNYIKCNYPIGFIRQRVKFI